MNCEYIKYERKEQINCLFFNEGLWQRNAFPDRKIKPLELVWNGNKLKLKKTWLFKAWNENETLRNLYE